VAGASVVDNGIVSRTRGDTVHRHRPITSAWLGLLALSCAPTEPGDELGGQSGSLRDDPLDLPEDVDTIDYQQAVDAALEVVLASDLATTWQGHVGMLASGDATCPAVFLGAPEDAMADDDDELVSWVGGCEVDGSDYDGFVTWSSAVDPESGEGARSLSGDASVVAGNGDTRFQFDGEASDSVVWTGPDDFVYTSTIEGQVSGVETFDASSAVPGGFRGNVTLTTGSDGTLQLDANLFLFGQPLLDRFDSVVVDLEFTDECGEEPLGYVGLRGIDGYWFDVYFMPRYDPDEGTVDAQAYPYEIIDDAVCDGCGHLFVRNVAIEDAGLVCPDFSGIRSSTSAPPIDDYVLTLHDPPWETE